MMRDPLSDRTASPNPCEKVRPGPANPFPRRTFLRLAAAGTAATCFGLPGSSPAADLAFLPELPLIPAPQNPDDWPAFRRQLAEWRTTTRQRLSYSDALYRRPEFGWAASCFSCCFLMLCDEQFYDPKTGKYRVAEFLGHGREEFGGYDAVVLWHAYPRIGADDRNQFDFYRDVPGGILGLRQVIHDFHARGVRVFLDYNPWDTGTRREGKPDLEVLATMIQALDADGLFLDTMDQGAEAFRARLDAVRPSVVLEGEIALPVDRIRDHHLSWAQGFKDSEAPGVLRNKWFERRHLQHQVRRWDTDHTGELHIAWMNGSGMMVWENVFGSWMGWSPRDRSLLRSMLPIQRRYAELFAGEDWTPLVPTQQKGLYASQWVGRGLRLWTLVNRSEREITGALLSVPSQPGQRFFDLIAGTEGQPANPGEHTVLSGTIGPRGIGGFLAGTVESVGDEFDAFLADQRAVTARAEWSVIPPKRTVVVRAPPAATKARRSPKEMAVIPATTFPLVTELRVRECGFYESSPAAGHTLADSYQVHTERFERTVVLGRYAIDRTPVTNAQFAEFLRNGGYRPRHPENFLKHWGHGHPPAGKEEHPVVYVSLEDARAYATWVRKRLPTEAEWQHAAQGPDALRYPWGNEMTPGRCNGGETGDTTPVMAFADFASPFGVYDLCGNVWEWTESERSDGRTRFCLLKGGAWYTAKGSGWYFDGGPQPNQHSAKFLLHWPGLDRCATIGFRCVMDLR
jgi:formylglycine-generating enzyme required for sulfatase activity